MKWILVLFFISSLSFAESKSDSLFDIWNNRPKAKPVTPIEVAGTVMTFYGLSDSSFVFATDIAFICAEQSGQLSELAEVTMTLVSKLNLKNSFLRIVEGSDIFGKSASEQENEFVNQRIARIDNFYFHQFLKIQKSQAIAACYRSSEKL